MKSSEMIRLVAYAGDSSRRGVPTLRLRSWGCLGAPDWRGAPECPYYGATYRCQRCWCEVCWCSGGERAAICDECYEEASALGLKERHMTRAWPEGENIHLPPEILFDWALSTPAKPPESVEAPQR